MFKKVVVNHQPASHSSRVGIRLMLIGIAMLTLGQSVGCKSFIKNVGDATALAYRDVVWSKRAYNLRYANCDRAYAKHFENGFRAGYANISRGGDGFVPALPPMNYRSFEFQSADGAKCVNSWFEGYPAGVAAAKKDDTGTYNDIMISRLIDRAIKQGKTVEAAPDGIPAVEPKQVSQIKIVQPSDIPQNAQQASPKYAPLVTPQYAPPSVSQNMTKTVKMPPIVSQKMPTTVNMPPIVRPMSHQVGVSPTQTSRATPEDVTVVSDSPVMTAPTTEPEFSVIAKSKEPLPMAQAPANWNSTRRVR